MGHTGGDSALQVCVPLMAAAGNVGAGSPGAQFGGVLHVIGGLICLEPSVAVHRFVCRCVEQTSCVGMFQDL